ncbi:hypothetical protein ACFQZ8_02075 [Micromonospora azadirachtae]|uniref:Secreted protein n=1 Tax=Micromonospora azadirachtae TaxID=1970735 RepID=A0ABW2ZVR6_9ACTN
MTDWWAFGVAAAALVTSIGTGWYSRSNANAAERSAKAAEDARDEAAKVARVELDRDHRDYTPKLSGRWDFEPRANHRQNRGLVYLFKLDREYLVHATATADNGNSHTVCTVTPPGSPDGEWQVWVEDWTPDRKESAWRKLKLDFWPPQRQEGRAQPWWCRCGRPSHPGEASAHWDLTVDVAPKHPPQVIVMR